MCGQGRWKVWSVALGRAAGPVGPASRGLGRSLTWTCLTRPAGPRLLVPHFLPSSPRHPASVQCLWEEASGTISYRRRQGQGGTAQWPAGVTGQASNPSPQQWMGLWRGGVLSLLSPGHQPGLFTWFLGGCQVRPEAQGCFRETGVSQGSSGRAPRTHPKAWAGHEGVAARRHLGSVCRGRKGARSCSAQPKGAAGCRLWGGGGAGRGWG